MRKLNVFEIILFFLGMFFIIISYISIHKLLLINGFSWDALIAIFVWIIIVVAIIIAAVLENMKEELKTIISQGHEETKLLRNETALLRKDLKYKNKNLSP